MGALGKDLRYGFRGVSATAPLVYAGVTLLRRALPLLLVTSRRGER